LFVYLYYLLRFHYTYIFFVIGIYDSTDEKALRFLASGAPSKSITQVTFPGHLSECARRRGISSEDFECSMYDQLLGYGNIQEVMESVVYGNDALAHSDRMTLVEILFTAFTKAN